MGFWAGVTKVQKGWQITPEMIEKGESIGVAFFPLPHLIFALDHNSCCSAAEHR
jgi:hypothetical protein